MATPTPADNVGPYYFFLVEGNRTGSRVDEITLLTQADFPSFPEFSPDGRWLLFTSRGTIVYVVDTTTGRTVIINQNGDQGTFSGWSADGQWLLQKHDDHLSLTAPAHDYRLIAQRDFAGCYHVFWVDEE
jgi:Tol biopolymer transport system component